MEFLEQAPTSYMLYTTPKFMPIIAYVHFGFALTIVLILSNVQL